ncbi:DUF1129 family protein [Macrococcus sp. EM39E]|uniref:DUF1129 family protein n=1 Tax=Macrococcus animalis TaxID=3395467 RepID=UPI0039BF5AFB
MTSLNEMNIEYVRKVNQLRPKNKEAFEYVASCITNNVMLSEDESDEMILEILEDLIIAQSNCTSAEHFFGNDLDSFISDLTKELPKRTVKSFLVNIIFNLSIVLIIMFFILGFTDIILLASEGEHIDIPIYSTIISIILMIVLCCISVFIKPQAYEKRSTTRNIISECFNWLIYGVFYISFNVFNTAPYFKFPFYISFIMFGIMIYISVQLKRKYFPKKQFI